MYLILAKGLDTKKEKSQSKWIKGKSNPVIVEY